MSLDKAIHELQRAQGFYNEHASTAFTSPAEDCLEAVKEQVDKALALLQKEKENQPEELAVEDRERIVSVLLSRAWHLGVNNPQAADRLRKTAERVKKLTHLQTTTDPGFLSAEDWAMIAVALVYVADKGSSLDGWTNEEAVRCRAVAETLRANLNESERQWEAGKS